MLKSSIVRIPSQPHLVRKGRRVHLDRNDLDRWIETNKE